MDFVFFSKNNKVKSENQGRGEHREKKQVAKQSTFALCSHFSHTLSVNMQLWFLLLVLINNTAFDGGVGVCEKTWRFTMTEQKEGGGFSSFLLCVYLYFVLDGAGT